MTDGRPPWWPWARDVILLLGGCMGVTAEVFNSIVLQGSVDYGLLALFGGMMGLPYTLRRDGGDR
jgi:hypothetical protein